MYADVVMEMDKARFEKLIDEAKGEEGRDARHGAHGGR
jgi:hypothetical protein